jgi:hypothetical protein
LAPSRTCRVGRQFAGQQLDQRRLAGAVGADDAEPVAAQDAGREIPDDGRSPKALAIFSASTTSLPETLPRRRRA